MKTYTKEEQRANLEGACKALEENPKKARLSMRDLDGGRCCLCVMEDYAISIDSDVRKGCDKFPHKDLSKFYGLVNSKGIRTNGERSFSFEFKNGNSANYYNDANEYSTVKELTHKEIAARIREDFLS